MYPYIDHQHVYDERQRRIRQVQDAMIEQLRQRFPGVRDATLREFAASQGGPYIIPQAAQYTAEWPYQNNVPTMPVYPPYTNPQPPVFEPARPFQDMATMTIGPAQFAEIHGMGQNGPPQPQPWPIPPDPYAQPPPVQPWQMPAIPNAQPQQPQPWQMPAGLNDQHAVEREDLRPPVTLLMELFSAEQNLYRDLAVEDPPVSLQHIRHGRRRIRELYDLLHNIGRSCDKYTSDFSENVRRLALEARQELDTVLEEVQRMEARLQELQDARHTGGNSLLERPSAFAIGVFGRLFQGPSKTARSDGGGIAAYTNAELLDATQGRLSVDMAEISQTVSSSYIHGKLPKTCPVCAEDRTRDEFGLSCSYGEHVHAIDGCVACLRDWIKSSLSESHWDHASCIQCMGRLSYESIKRFADKETFSTYDRLLTRRALGEDVDFRWCTKVGCGSGQLHEGGDAAPLFQCTACGHRFCIVHDVPWHEGQTCSDFDEDRDWQQRKRIQEVENQASADLVKKVSKKCPGRGCNYDIEKDDGCDHITCNACRYEFCYRCLADYNAIRYHGNSAHGMDCPHWRPPGGYVHDPDLMNFQGVDHLLGHATMQPLDFDVEAMLIAVLETLRGRMPEEVMLHPRDRRQHVSSPQPERHVDGA